ncbi:TonB-dependent receptor [Sphingomonas gilva]|uniref:TonB-dependent receptor n=1 Tax=Sphingomonas gilva TaxID=2305907 RepID=A0A396RKE8_9SPHN|nr:TonB-dependent receptor [Sphingomonas gilva]RHW16680.1 TonB-dependent receptor [Sphingomonas gilva]
MTNWTRRAIAGFLTTTALATGAHAQTEPASTQEPPVEAGTAPATDPGQGFGEEIIVTGIRASQAKSIDLKRESAAIVDAISAEDIGKLPDVTIVDSLQRISGVQIVRSAGEGATVNIRGLPQVVTLLNGEQYLSPANLGTAQPNLNDIPAQLMSGVVVFKSPDVRNALSGISGTLDLRTRRPFDFKDGLTVSGQGEYQTGKYTSTDDYLVSGLASYRTGRIGILASAAYSDITLGNNYAGFAGGHFLNNDWGGNGNAANPGADWIAPHGYETFHREVERKRFGASGAIQWEVDDGITLTAEGFYTRFIEHDLRAGMNISNRWNALGWMNPTVSEDSGVEITRLINNVPTQQSVLDVDEYDLDAWWVNSFSVNRSIKAESKNFNLELEYDKGGPLTFSVRGIYSDADYLNTNGQVQGDLSNWQYGPDRQFTLFRNAADRTRGTFYPADIASQYPASQYSNGVVGVNGGRYVNPNPLGYGSDPQLHIDISGRNIVWSGFDRVIGGGLGADSTLRDYMSNLDSYTVAAYSSEGNNRNNSDLYAARFDGSFDFEKADGALFGFLNRIDAGGRASRRRTEIQNYHLFSNLYAGNGASDPNGCAAQWKAIDVVLDNTAGCTAGEHVPNPNFNPALPVSASNPETVFQGYTAWRPTNLGANNNVYFLDDFGSVTEGFPGIWVADPRDFNDPLAFQQRVFGNAFPVIIPGTSYNVDFYEQSGYANAALEFGALQVNAGLRVVHTLIKVRQNLTGPVIPYGDTNSDIGDTFDRNDYWDFLPVINAQVDLTDNLKARAAYSKTMIPLDLGNYGGGLTISTSDSPGVDPDDPTTANNAPEGVRQVTGASAAGNPHLNPWRSTNYDVALEYYWGRASLLNAGVFLLDIESFVTTDSINDGRFPDGDGVIRRTVPFSRPIQGTGGSLQGVELGAKVAFDDIIPTDGILSNFGFDANYTYSDSANESAAPQLDGSKFPFQDNSAHQWNFAFWYQDSRLQARAAYNRRSPRLTGQVNGIAIYQDTSQYVDLNVTYAITDNFSLYGNASNVFGEIEKYYYQFDEDSRQFAWRNEFEPRYSAGVRFKF